MWLLRFLYNKIENSFTERSETLAPHDQKMRKSQNAQNDQNEICDEKSRKLQEIAKKKTIFK